MQGQVSLSLDSAGSYLMVDGLEVGTDRVSGPPYTYPFDTTTVTDGQHNLQLWAHDIGNNTVVSAPVAITVANASATPPASPAPPLAPPAGPAPPTAPPVTVPSAYPIALTYPVSGQGVSGVVQVSANITQTLDSAASYLMIDGAETGWQRVGSAPYLYPLDTSGVSAGAHTLQIWAHDTNNNVLLSNPVTINIAH